MRRQPFTLLIHIALAIIVAGAIVTHYSGISGELTLRDGAPPTDRFVLKSGPVDGTFPFTVALESAEIDFYPATSTPMDFRSHLLIDGERTTVAMNRVACVRGWRFFQSGISPDSTRLTVSHDPVGTGITYTGYVLLFIGMAGFFFQRRSAWRSLLRAARRSAAAVVLLTPIAASADATPGLPAMQRPLVANFGKLCVMWNDRVTPVQTMARDVTLKLYGSESYRGMTPEQVLSGWLFYFDEWQSDYTARGLAGDGGSDRSRKRRDERLALVSWLGTGEAFRFYPYRTADGRTEWLSLTGRRPSKMSLEQWTFMLTAVPRVKELLLQGRNIDADRQLSLIADGQRRYAGADNLPSDARIAAERFFNRWIDLLPAAVAAMLSGCFCLWSAIRGIRPSRQVAAGVTILSALLLLYVVATLGLMGWISGHMPLSNGPEMMIFMSMTALAGSIAVRNSMLRGACLTVAATTLAVAFMGGRSPRIGMLMPVLASPLLSVHVMLVMTSYVFFLIMAILAAAGLCSHDDRRQNELFRTNRLLLVPAVFLLGAGMFVGAVWANCSWGRYWGWDPKETCALVMFLIYSLPLHWAARPLRAFRRPRFFQWYILAAVGSVLFTYFGANYFLSGLHSYA